MFRYLNVSPSVERRMREKKAEMTRKKYLPKRSIKKITKNTQFFSFSDIQKIRLSTEKVSAIRQKLSDGRATVDNFLSSTINCPYVDGTPKIAKSN